MRKTNCPNCGATFRALRPGELRILDALNEKGLRFTDLLRKTGLSPPALSPYLKGLVTEGYLVKDDVLYAQSEAYRADELNHFYAIDGPRAINMEDYG